jgi:hypothetical protein
MLILMLFVRIQARAVAETLHVTVEEIDYGI